MEESDYAELGPPGKSKRSKRHAQSKKHAKKGTKPPKSETSKHDHDQDKHGKASSKPKRTNQSRGLPEVPREVNYNNMPENSERKSHDIKENKGNGHASLPVSSNNVKEISPNVSKIEENLESKESIEDVAYAKVMKKRENRQGGTQHSATANGPSRSPVSERVDSPTEKYGSAEVLIKSDEPAEQPDVSDQVTYATVQSDRKSRKTKQSNDESIKTSSLSDDKGPRKANKNKQEPTVDTGEVTYATVPRKKDRKSRKTQESKEGSDTSVVQSDGDISKKTSPSSKEAKRVSTGFADDVSYATVQRKREEKQLPLNITVDIHASLEKNYENTSNTTDGSVSPPKSPDGKALSKEQRDVKPNNGTGGEIFPKSQLSKASNNSSQISRQKWSSERRGSSSISRNTNQRDGIISGTASNNHRQQQQNYGIKRSLSLQERRPGNALLQLSLSGHSRAASISSNQSNKSSISSSSRIGNDSLRRDSLYNLIPEEPDEPLPNISPLESLKSPDDEVITEGNTSPSAQSSGEVIGGHVLVPGFEDEGYKRTVSMIEKTKARERRNRILRILLCLIFLLLITVSAVVGGLVVLFLLNEDES